MLKTLLTATVLVAAAGAATAQSPAPVFGSFKPVGTTGKLHTAESREYWKKMGHKFDVVDSAADAVTDKLGLPHVHPAAALAAAKAKAPARKDDADVTSTRSSLWFGADKLGAAFKTNGGH